MSLPLLRSGPVFGKQPLGKAAHGGDAGAGGNEDGVGYRLFENKVAVGAVNLDRAPDGQIGQVGQVVGEETALDAVHAQLEAVAVGGGGQRVGAGLLLAVGVLGHGGDELAGGEGEAFELVEDELEVVALRRFGDADFLVKTCGKKLTGQGGSRWKEG